MNNCFKVIWNAATATFVAVPETAKGQGAQAVGGAPSAGDFIQKTVTHFFIKPLVAALICIALGFYAVQFGQSAYALGERGMAIPIKVWPIQLILPWMFFSSAIRHLVFMAYPALRPEPKGEMH